MNSSEFFEWQDKEMKEKNAKSMLPMPDSSADKEYYTGFSFAKLDQTKPTTGVKYDEDKLRYDLIPPLALEEVVKVLTAGAKIYEPENWRNVEGWKDRYFAAPQRHQWKWKRGKIWDDEPDAKGRPGTNRHHIACAIASLMFLLEKELEAEKENK
jgi:hypothetical protein